MDKKVCILSSREIGIKCIEWAKINTPKGFILTDDINKADVLISVLYEKILPQSILNNKICFNFHPGILPEYRGSGAFSWSIINQSSKTGITLHLIDEGIDTGDIIEIREYLISPQDTAYSLYNKGMELLLKMFKDWYVNLLNQQYIAVPQNENKSSIYFRKDLDKVKDLSRFIRAFHFPGKESAYFIDNNGKKCYIEFKI